MLELAEWVALASVHARLGNDVMAYMCEHIKQPGWYFAWLRYVIDLAQAERISCTSTDAAAQSLLAALKRLEQHRRPFEGKPRACDLYYVHPVIHDTFRRALHLLKNHSLWQAGLESLRQIGRQTSTVISGDRYATGPLAADSFAELLTSSVDRGRLPSLVITWLREVTKESEQKGEYYSTHAGHHMRLAMALAQTGDEGAALREWRQAAQSICGYTCRKDITVWESFEPAPGLAKASPGRALHIYARSQKLSVAVLYHTDGKETKHAPNAWFDAFSETLPSKAAVMLAWGMTEEGGERNRFHEEAIVGLIGVASDRSEPLIAFLLETTTPVGSARRRLHDRQRLLQQIVTQLPSLAPALLRITGARLADDPAGVDEEARQELYTLARATGVAMSPPGERVAAEDGYEHPPSLPEPVNREQAWEVRECCFESNPRPSAILSAIRGMRYTPSQTETREQLRNALGYRLVEMLEHGDEANVLRILSFLGSEWQYQGSGELLVELGDGLARAGYHSAAAAAKALAYMYLRRDWRPGLTETPHKRYPCIPALPDDVQSTAPD